MDPYGHFSQTQIVEANFREIEMDIKIEMLRCFAEVARRGNLADAAAQLGRSASAVSMTLKQLQDQLGSPLFASDRKTQLTPLGAFVLEQAKAELVHFDQTKQAISAYLAGGEAVLRIGAVPSAAAFLPAAIGQFLTVLPNVRISLRDQDSEQIVRDLGEGALDVGLASAPGQILRMHRLPVLSDQFGVVCHAAHPLASKIGGLAAVDLHAHRFITNPLVAGLSDPDLRALGEGAQIHVTNTLSLLSMIEAGVGLTILPKTAVETANARLSFLPLARPLAHRKIDALFSQTQVLSQPQATIRSALEMVATS